MKSFLYLEYYLLTFVVIYMFKGRSRTLKKRLKHPFYFDFHDVEVCLVFRRKSLCFRLGFIFWQFLDA